MIKINIFIINGQGSVGKTSFEKMVQEIGVAHGDNIKILSTIDYVKDIAKEFGWDGKKELKDRKMLSDLKDLLTEWNDIPYKKICEKINECNQNNIKAIFIDSREPQEIQRFVNDYQALTVLIKRSNIKMIYGNHADDEVENYHYDCIIDNSRGLTELLEEATIFYETFINSKE